MKETASLFNTLQLDYMIPLFINDSFNLTGRFLII